MSEVKLSVWEASIIKNLERSMVAPKNRITRIQERVQRAIDKGSEEIAEIEEQITGIEAMIVKVKEDAAARQNTSQDVAEEAEAPAQPEVFESEALIEPLAPQDENIAVGPGNGESPWPNYDGTAPDTSISDIFND